MNAKFRKAAVVVAGAFICGNSVATSAELRMIGNPGMSEIMARVAPEFEKSTMHRIPWELWVFQKLKPVIDQRDFDVIVSTGEVADYAANQKAVNGELVSVAQVGIGVAIKKGAPKPDISTVEAFKRTLLAAKSVGFVEQGASGIYLKSLIQRLGIENDLKSKLKMVAADVGAGGAVAKGEVEIGITQIPEILPFA